MSNNSDTPATIYISTAPDLAAERDTLARAIAELPVTLVWRIFQTPAATEPLDREAVQAADLHLLVMGADIRAPVGLEWAIARHAGRPSAAFLKQDVARTPAGHVFVSQAEVAWHRFTDAADLGRQVQRVLAEHLLHHATHYALTLIEVEQLEALRATEAGKETEEPAAGEGAGSSAVILSRERFVPREGVVVNDRWACAANARRPVLGPAWPATSTHRRPGDGPSSDIIRFAAQALGDPGLTKTPSSRRITDTKTLNRRSRRFWPVVEKRGHRLKAPRTAGRRRSPGSRVGEGWMAR